jgi:hypothetical protein
MYNFEFPRRRDRFPGYKTGMMEFADHLIFRRVEGAIRVHDKYSATDARLLRHGVARIEQIAVSVPDSPVTK